MGTTDRKEYRLTLERSDGTWGQYNFWARDVQEALRWVARSVDLDYAKNVHIVEVED